MTLDEVSVLEVGAYRVYWTSGGTSIASIGVTNDGTHWLEPENWVQPVLDGSYWDKVDHVELIEASYPRRQGMKSKQCEANDHNRCEVGYRCDCLCHFQQKNAELDERLAGLTDRVPSVQEQLTYIRKAMPKDGPPADVRIETVHRDRAQFKAAVIETTTHADTTPQFLAQVVIHRAEYGVPGRRMVDVTDAVRKRQKEFSTLEMLVSNHNLGGDPVRGRRKTLVITFHTTYGKQGVRTVTFREKEVARLNV